MIRNNGTITYKPENASEAITKKIAHIEWNQGLLSLFEVDHEDNVLEEIFLYDPDKENWYLPNYVDDYGEVVWKQFQGDILEFGFKVEYVLPTTQFVDNNM